MRVAVQFSNLEAKKAMVSPLLECILQVKNATRGLQKLTSKIGGAVDRYAHQILFILASANICSVTVVQANALEKLEGTRFHAMSIIRCDPFQNSVAAGIFEQSLDHLLRHLQGLISEIETHSRKLRTAEACLTSIQELIFHESFTLVTASSDLLQDVWTKIGSNRKELRKYEQDLALLKDLTFGRRLASGCVTRALKTLREARLGMEGIMGRYRKHFT